MRYKCQAVGPGVWTQGEGADGASIRNAAGHFAQELCGRSKEGDVWVITCEDTALSVVQRFEFRVVGGCVEHFTRLED